MQPKYKAKYRAEQTKATAMKGHIQRMEDKMKELDEASQMIDEMIEKRETENLKLQKEYDDIEAKLGSNIQQLIDLRAVQQKVANFNKF